MIAGVCQAPAMEVAYWELVPYMPGLKVADLTRKHKNAYIQANTGKNFVLMIDACEETRQQVCVDACKRTPGRTISCSTVRF